MRRPRLTRLTKWKRSEKISEYDNTENYAMKVCEQDMDVYPCNTKVNSIANPCRIMSKFCFTFDMESKIIQDMIPYLSRTKNHLKLWI
jgi:hypothetical protein